MLGTSCYDPSDDSTVITNKNGLKTTENDCYKRKVLLSQKTSKTQFSGISMPHTRMCKTEERIYASMQ